MSPNEGFARTRFGRIHHASAGAGEPLILLHSNGCSLHEYASSMPLLARDHRCIAWDMPGHGDSDRPGGHLSVEDYADAVVELMDALSIPMANVCGASIGGMVCIALGARHPDRMSSVVIAEAPLRTTAEWASQWPRIEAQFALPRQTLDEIRGRFRAADDALLARWNIDREKAGSWRMVDVMWAIRDFDAIAALARVGCPAGVLIGDRGPVYGHRERYEETLPGVPVQVIGDAGHFPMLDDPAAFADAVRRGIRSATRPGR